MIDLHAQTLGGLSQSGGTSTVAELWQAAAEVGYTTATVPGALGGGDGSIDDGAAIARAAARVLYNAPIAVSSVVLGPLLAAAGWEAREDVPAVVIDGSEGPRSVVDFGADAKVLYHVAMLPSGSRLRLLDLRSDLRLSLARRGEPAHVASIDLASAAVLDETVLAQPYEQWVTLGALSSAVQITGAVDAIVDRTVDYLNTRVQFGRALIGFQALQHRLAELSARAELLGHAVDEAVGRWSERDAGAYRATAVAKIEAAQIGAFAASEAHQLHGAIGYTEEAGLGEYSKLVWSQARRFGSGSWWRDWLGARDLAADLWADSAPLGTSAAGA